MKSSKELEQEIKRYKAFAKKKIGRLTASWLRAIQYEEEHPSPEVSAQEAIMTARVQKFEKHVWEPGDTLYHASLDPMGGNLIVHKYTVDTVADGHVKTKGSALLPFTSISTDELASISLLYARAKDKSVSDDQLHLWKNNFRYRFRRYVREWFFEAKANLEAKHESS